MKVNDILQEDQLDEIKLRHVLAGAALGAAIGAGGVTKLHADQKDTEKTRTVQVAKDEAKKELTKKLTPAQEEQLRVKELTDSVLSKYKHNISAAEAEKVVKLAIKHETSNFTAEDILAQIGVESSFKKTAVSKLKKDPAVGYTQIRPKIWGMKANELSGSVEKQIKKTYEILDHYYQKLGNKEDAWHAYNVGITNFKRKKGLNPEYTKKIKRELTRYM
jgi:soluble lytic murein transglycosylase-like protein